MWVAFKAYARDEAGASAGETALLVAVVGGAIAFGALGMKSAINQRLNQDGVTVASVSTGGSGGATGPTGGSTGGTSGGTNGNGNGNGNGGNGNGGGGNGKGKGN